MCSNFFCSIEESIIVSLSAQFVENKLNNHCMSLRNKINY